MQFVGLLDRLDRSSNSAKILKLEPRCRGELCVEFYVQHYLPEPFYWLY